MDHASFEQVFRAHYGQIVAYARRRGSSWDQAHDVAAEVFAIAWRRRDQVPMDAVRPWLFGVSRRVLANMWRSQRRRRGVVTRLIATSHRPLTRMPVLEDDGMAAALLGLSDADREVLMWVAWDGLSHREIGHMLGLSESGVASRVSRARHRLCRALNAHPAIDVGDR